MVDRRMDRDWEYETVPYPDPAWEVFDARFGNYMLGSSPLERLFTGARWTEGPVWFGDGRYLLFSDIPNNRILKWSEESGEVSVYRHPSNNANGHTRDNQGRLVSCEHGSRRVTRTEYDGTITILVDRFEGKPLNAPNDVVVHADDSIWFTDPGYGIIWNYEGNKATFELDTNVYRLDPATGGMTIVTSELEKPNGLAFSPDFSVLYIADTGASHKRGHPRYIEAFDVTDDGKGLAGRRVFYDMGKSSSDGFRVDIDGNVWTSAGWSAGENGVLSISPEGEKLGMIHLPEPVSNLCFGGVKRNRLFITAGRSLFSIYTDTQGMPYGTP
ncbi:MAG: gluconolactonase [Gammaproteobacteria bacterium]|nr:gluconolactonase [Gammaproteobacteria bacterium]OUU06563.1 MAG: gluconolactonase [Gammaproteobacteria bacterium TMED34]